MTVRISKKNINLSAVLDRILTLTQNTGIPEHKRNQLNAVIDAILDLDIKHITGFEHLMQQLDTLEKY